MCVMKLNKYFMMGAMGLSLVACSDNLDENGQSANGTNPNEGTTYVAFTVDFNNASSRAGEQPVGGEADSGDGNEADINDVRIIVTNEDGTVEFNDVATKKTVGLQDYFMIAIQPGMKNFYAIVNGESHGLTAPTTWGEKILATITSEDNNDVNVKASDLYEYNATSGQSEGFVMSSIAAVPQRIYDNVTEEEAQAGPNNRVNITVNRMVAKVTVKLADKLVSNTGNDFGGENFALKSLSARIMNADNVKYENPTLTYAGSYWMAYDNTSGVRETPYYSYIPGADVPETALESGSSQPLYAPGETTKNPSRRFYCLENTHSNTEDNTGYKQGNTTYLKLEATMVPEHLVTFVKSDGNITVTDKEYSGDAATFYVVNGYSGEGDGEEVVYCVLASDLVAAYSTIVTEGTETEDDAKIEAVIDALETAGYKIEDVYENGVGTYRIPVNDIQEGGEYTNIQPVFRNDWYDIEITGISLPGDPAGGGFEPEQPFHQSTNVAFVVTAREWNKVSHEVDLQ